MSAPIGSRGYGGVRRVGRIRETGMHSVSRITRISVAVSLALTALFSAVAARGFSGRSHTSAAGSSVATASTGGASTGQRVALPPANDGSLSAPVAPPVSQPAPAPPPVTSGGS